MKLSAKASVLLVFVVAAFLTTAVYTATFFAERIVRENVFTTLDNQAEHAAWDCREFLLEGMRTTEAIASEIPAQAVATRDNARIEEYLKRMSGLFPIFEDGIFLIDKDGNFLASQPAAPNMAHQSLASREFYQRALSENRTVIATPHMSKRTNMPVLTFASPVKDAQGNTVGVLGCASNLYSPQALGNLRNVKIGRAGFVTITDQERRVILHPQNRWVLATLPEGGNPMVEAALAGSNVLHGESVNTEGVHKVISGKRIDLMPWVVWVTVPQSEVYAPIRQMRSSALWLTLASLLLAASLGVLGMRGITRPLTVLTESATHLASKLEVPGELSGEAEPSLHPALPDLTRRRDEIGSLAKAFLDLSAKLDKAFSALVLARDEAEKADWAKSEYLAVMSHGIRTPLTSVLGALDALRETPLSEEQKEFVQAAKKAGSGLLATLSNILDLSRIETDRLEIVHAPFLLASVMDTCRAVFEKRAARKGVALDCNCPSELPSVVVGDQARLRQMLFNLIGNAIKFTDKGSITVEALPGSASDRIRFVVSDTGRGLNPDQLEAITRAFEATERQPLPGRQSPGLGLSIVARLVSLMGGEIFVSSRPGQGASFSVDIPLPPADTAGATDLSDAPGCASDHPETCAILLAEDDRTNQVVIRRLLEKRGFMVLCANDGQQALDILKETNVALVLMDVNMPVMGGEEATKLIRAMEGGKGRVPIVALTADALKGDRERFLAMGMDDYVSKPVDMDLLMKVLGRWL